MAEARRIPIRLRSAVWVFPWRVMEFLGKEFLARCNTLVSILAILWATAGLSLRRSSWTSPVRTIFARQLLFTAVDAVPVALRFGAAGGVLVIAQAAMWSDSMGADAEGIVPLIWRAIIRELAPLLACLVVIGRSGIAISTELSLMYVHGEIEVLDAQGIDPMTCLVMPRILSMIISVFCLAIIVATSMLMTGYLIGWSMGTIRFSAGDFSSDVLRQFDAQDLLFFVPKTIVAGAFAGAICCIDGLSIRGSSTDVPRVAARSGIRALTAVFAVSAVLSILIYNRFLIFDIR
ncbi:ABC transporter permease [Neorhodopirellula pilleata]|uniref:Putative phospholipid ABC transporter permease protein MlaE n=1 Tax=Neorhodopirellula pilleata TaxID=2714738 RepID=A0A5C6A9I1_9BACT|nr:ABC transporter permease [Neorhodopirellula pilleata]TWT95701.1 putative phospholipid ABC transporter permease protein MlaE [Neorhodopirellula pilleata]